MLMETVRAFYLGFCADLDGARVYHAGGTAYRAPFLPAVRELRP